MSNSEFALSAGGDSVRDIDRDVRCVSCGYNLRSLNPDGVCPECGVAVNRTIDGDWLRYADGEWLRHIVGALRWAMRCWVAFIEALSVVFVCGLVAMAVGEEGSVIIGWIIGGVTSLAGVVILLSLIGIGASIYQLARPEPLDEHRYWFRRDLLRRISVIIVPLIIISVPLQSMAFLLEWSPPPGLVSGISCACTFIIWAHTLLLLSQALDLGTRCKAATPKRLRKLKIYRSNATGLLAFCLITQGVGVGTNTIMFGAGAPSDFSPILAASSGTAALIWFLVVGLLGNVRDLVQGELDAAESSDVPPRDGANFSAEAEQSI